jgi:predicted nucleic acid-binding protein
MGINVAPLTEVMAERAAELRAQHVRLRLPDAMVLACAAELEGELLTYDERLAAIARSAP